jgi:pSer/pThr/pTyr-binding forkhead associated (FHA) protein
MQNSENSVKGHVVVIRRDGTDGGKFPVSDDILIGRMSDCHIRVNLSTVSRRHAIIKLGQSGNVLVENRSKTNPTLVNNDSLECDKELQHRDIICIGDRSFRWEYSNYKKIAASPESLTNTSSSTIESPRSALKETNGRGGAATPLEKEAAVEAVLAERKKPLNTPLRNAIIAKWSKFFANQEAEEENLNESDNVIDEYKEEACLSPETKVVESEESIEEYEGAKRSLPTPLRSAIKKRRLGTPCMRVPIEAAKKTPASNTPVVTKAVPIAAKSVSTTPKYNANYGTPENSIEISKLHQTPVDNVPFQSLEISPQPAKHIVSSTPACDGMGRLFKSPKEKVSYSPACDGMGALFLTPAVVNTEKAISADNDDLEELARSFIEEEAADEEISTEEQIFQNDSVIEGAAVEEQRVEKVSTEELVEEGVAKEVAFIEDVPAEENVVEQAGVEDVPAEETKIEHTVVEDVPAGETVVEQAVFEDVPAEEIVVEETVDEDAQVKETDVNLTIEEYESATDAIEVVEPVPAPASRRRSRRLSVSKAAPAEAPAKKATSKRRSRRLSRLSIESSEEVSKKESSTRRRRSRRLSGFKTAVKEEITPVEVEEKAEVVPAEDAGEIQFATREDCPINMQFITSCKKGTVIEALDFDSELKSFVYFNALVVDRPSKSKGVPIKWSDSKGNASGPMVHTKHCRAFVPTRKQLEAVAEVAEETFPDLTLLRVVDLQKQLKKIGLPTKGRKALLIKRLEEFHSATQWKQFKQ